MAAAIPRGPMLLNETGGVVGAACTGTFDLLSSCNFPWYSSRPPTGKVFFTMGGSNYVCSGSIGANYLVWTAGHCVYDQSAGFATSWSFVPGYCGSGTQYSATNLYTTSQWQNGAFSHDYGLAGFAGSPFAGRAQLAIYIAPNPLTTTYTSEGYPAGSPFNGRFLNRCVAQGCERDSGNPATIGIACDSTGGSSGGPWIYNNAFIASVNSYGYNGVPNVMYGPYFNAATRTFFNNALGAQLEQESKAQEIKAQEIINKE